MFLHSARASTFFIFRYALCGSMGSPSFTGDGNIHSESVRALSSFSTFTTAGGRMTVREEFFVFGSEKCSAPPSRITCR